MNLTKISIIAKDVSDAPEDDLSLDDAARYEHRTHLKGYLAEDYEYKQRDLPPHEPKEDDSRDGSDA